MNIVYKCINNNNNIVIIIIIYTLIYDIHNALYISV
jgi:hypothetical protein